MDVTPGNKMFSAMAEFVDATIGAAPKAIDVSPAANNRRVRREHAFAFLHKLVGLSMREGVNRAILDAQAKREGPRDMEDKNAVAKAKDDAAAGSSIIQLPH